MVDNNENQEKATLFVKGLSKDRNENKEYVKKLSNAICSVFRKHGTVNLRYVGPGAGNNADKAIIIAIETIYNDSGETIAYIPEFVPIYFDDVEMTGIVKKIIKIDDFYEALTFSGSITDDNLLLVKNYVDDKPKNKKHINKLSNAILKVVEKHEEANLRFCGVGAGNNAEKASIKASLKSENILAVFPFFSKIDFDGEIRTGIIKKIINVKKKDN